MSQYDGNDDVMPTLLKLKARAKKMKKLTGLPHSVCLHAIAQQYGYKSYDGMLHLYYYPLYKINR